MRFALQASWLRRRSLGIRSCRSGNFLMPPRRVPTQKSRFVNVAKSRQSSESHIKKNSRRNKRFFISSLVRVAIDRNRFARKRRPHFSLDERAYPEVSVLKEGEVV